MTLPTIRPTRTQSSGPCRQNSTLYEKHEILKLIRHVSADALHICVQLKLRSLCVDNAALFLGLGLSSYYPDHLEKFKKAFDCY